MLQHAKTFLAKNVTRLPSWVNRELITLTRNPDRLLGRRYTRYRSFLREHEQSFDNVPPLLASVNRAIVEVPFYRDRYGGRTVGSMEEFENSIDFIDKDVIMANYDRFINPLVKLGDYDTGTTGGTSGKPLTFIAPKSRYIVELATMHSLWARAGCRFDVRAVIRNHRLNNGRRYLVNPLTREVIFDGFRLTGEYFEYIYKTIRQFGIRFVHCYPSTAFEFAMFLQQNGLDASCITAFLSGSENIFDHQREMIQGRLGIRFYNWYGHSEKLVLAGYCTGTDHYHVEPTYGYFELVDASGKEVREPGKVGEIVGTSFYNPGMPFIRYRTGDYAEYVGDYCSACNRHLPVIRNIRGRWSGDRIYNADGTFVTTTALNLHNELYQAINGMQYLQERKGELTVLIVKSPVYSSGHEASLYAHFYSKLRRDTVVTIQYVDRLRRLPNGKFVQVISSVE
ncbi:MAG: phenylacetate--CoA ligase family protein [Dissulfurispiraceae bacterium]